jgi:hypothetical protein
MNYIRIITYTAIILLLCTYVSFAQETKSDFKVKLFILGDKDIKQDTESYLGRELRSLGDVTVVGSGEDCLLWCNINKVITVSGKLTGFAFSVVYCERQDVEGLYSVRDKMFDIVTKISNLPKTKQQQELLESYQFIFADTLLSLPTIGKYSMQYSSLYIGPNDLRTLCETAITDFDNNYLKKKRDEFNNNNSETSRLDSTAPSVKLRSSYRDTSISQVQSMSNKSIRKQSDYGFYGYSTIPHKYTKASIGGDEVVMDSATGLMWHRAGSDSYYQTWDEAMQWVIDLNLQKYAGYDDWRIPTVEEATSLLESSKKNVLLFIDSIFYNPPEYVWTGDKGKDSELVWSVSFTDGGVRCVYHGGLYVLPVRSLK